MQSRGWGCFWKLRKGGQEEGVGERNRGRENIEGREKKGVRRSEQ